MNSATKWIVSFVHPRNGNFWAGLLTVGIIAGLSHWHEAWLNPRVEDWLSHQNGLTKFAGYFACGIGVYMVALIVIASVTGPIHYAIDPAYATERAQKRRVKQLKIGDRIRVTDGKDPECCGTVTRVSPTGESFNVTWDDDGHTNALWHFDVDIVELVK